MGVLNKTIEDGNKKFPGGSSKFFIFEEGDNKLRIVSPLEVFGQHYTPGEGYKICIGKEKGCNQCDEAKASPTYFCWVIDRRDGLIKEGKLSYTVLKGIDDVTAIEEYHFQPDASGVFPYDLNVRMIEGKAKNEKRTYNILPSPPSELTAEEREEIAKLEHPAKFIARKKAEITGEEVQEDIQVDEESPATPNEEPPVNERQDDDIKVKNLPF